MYGYEIFVVACITTVAIGAYWFAIAMAHEIQCILHSINDKIHGENENQPDELMILLREFIDTHGNLKQFSVLVLIFFNRLRRISKYRPTHV